MAELIAGLVEALVVIVEIIAAWAYAMLEGLAVLACFLFSSRFRTKKLEQWKLNPRKKAADVGLASVWFVLTILLPLGLFFASHNAPAKGEPVQAALASSRTNEDLRLELKFKRTNSQEFAGAVIVKKGGLKKLLETKSVSELKTQIVDNVSLAPVVQADVNSATNK